MSLIKPRCPVCGERDQVRLRWGVINILKIVASTICMLVIHIDIFQLDWRCKRDNVGFRSSGTYD